MATFRKRGKAWGYRIKYKGIDDKWHTIARDGFRLKTAAIESANKLENDIKKGADPRKADVLFMDYWHQWLKTYKIGDKAANTEYRYDLLGEHLNARFRGRTLKSIKPSEWQTFLNDLAAGKDLKNPHERSKDFISKMNSYVRSMVKTAINDQIIYSDFTHGAVVKGIRQSNKVKVLDFAAFSKIKELAEERASFTRGGVLAVYIGAVTGMRISEVLALTWPDIDAQKGVIHVHRSWDHVRGTGFKSTKTPSSIRDIEVSPAFFTVLERIHREQASAYLRTGYRDPDAMIMRGRQHTIPSSVACNKALNILQRLAKIPESKRITFHGLRHSHASYLISEGVDIYYISKRLGHSDITITMRVYGHLLNSQRKKEASKALAALDRL